MAKKKVLGCLLLLALTIPAVWPLLQPGFFVTDDGDWMIIRLSAFHETLKTGQFPARFLERLDHGLGYPVTNFLYPLPFYLGEIIHLVGFGFVDSIKILFILSFIFSAVFMYLYRGLLAALIYTYFPYHLFDVYRRGSLGEAVAFIFPPLIFYLIDKKKVILASLATAALVCSHNVVALLFLPVTIVYFFFREKSLIHTTYYILLSLVLSAWFWLPALYDLQFTKAATTQVSNFNDYFLWRP